MMECWKNGPMYFEDNIPVFQHSSLQVTRRIQSESWRRNLWLKYPMMLLFAGAAAVS